MEQLKDVVAYVKAEGEHWIENTMEDLAIDGYCRSKVCRVFAVRDYELETFFENLLFKLKTLKKAIILQDTSLEESTRNEIRESPSVHKDSQC